MAANPDNTTRTSDGDVDTHGRPLYIQITPGQQHESTVAGRALPTKNGHL